MIRKCQLQICQTLFPCVQHLPNQPVHKSFEIDPVAHISCSQLLLKILLCSQIMHTSHSGIHKGL